MEKTNDQFAEWKCDVTLQTLRILREYYEQPHVHKLDPLDEMDLFLENHKLPKHTKDETDSLINPLTINGIEFTVNPFGKKKQKKLQAQTVSLQKPTKHLKKHQSIYLFQKTEEKSSQLFLNLIKGNYKNAYS